MLANVLGNPVGSFLDYNGLPLQSGSIYIGNPNTDPTNPANEIAVFQDSGLSIPLQQPIRTINGQPTLNGSQIIVYLGLGVASYSLAIANAAGVIVASFPSVAPFSLGGSAAGSMVFKEFVAGVDFTDGTAPVLTLPAYFGSAANVFIDVDGLTQKPGIDYTLNGTTLAFTSSVPIGTQTINVRGGITAAVGTPAQGSVEDSTVAAGTKLYNRITDFVDLRDPIWNAICNGTTDDTAAVISAIAAIGANEVALIIPGPTLISSNVTFGANTTLWFLNSGSIVGKAGTEVVSVQYQIDAPRVQIFNNCLPVATTGQDVFPEWFGAKRNGATSDTAAFNLAYSYLKNVGGRILMAPGNYASASAIDAQYSKIALLGAGLEITTITVTSTNVDGIDCIGSPGNSVNAPVFEGFSLNCAGQTTVGAGINLQYTALAKVTDVQINGFIQGVNMLQATNTFFTRAGASYAGVIVGFMGFNINGGGANAGGNESSVWRDCYVQGSGTSGTGCIAYRAYGAYVSDLYFDNCSSAECNYGWELDYSVATANGYADVTLVNPVVDGFTLQGILVNQLPTGQKLSIIGGWINPASTGSETDDIYITGSGGQVAIGGGIQLQGDNNHANAVGVRVINSNNVLVGEAQFGNCNYGIKESGSGYNRYGGSYWNAQANTATACISMIGSSRTMVVGAVFQGYATVGVTADNTSDGVGVVGCTFNANLVTTAVVNSSTGPVGGSDGTLGLNSGA